MEFLRTCDEKINNKVFKKFNDGLYDVKTKINCEEFISMTGK